MRPQTLLVTGGMNGNDYLSSTEILHHGQHKWHTAAELPHSLTGLRGINLDNKILMTGRHHPRSYIANTPNAGGFDDQFNFLFHKGRRAYN